MISFVPQKFQAAGRQRAVAADLMATECKEFVLCKHLNSCFFNVSVVTIINMYVDLFLWCVSVFLMTVYCKCIPLSSQSITFCFHLSEDTLQCSFSVFSSELKLSCCYITHKWQKNCVTYGEICLDENRRSEQWSIRVDTCKSCAYIAQPITKL